MTAVSALMRVPETTFSRRSNLRPSPIRFLPPAIPTPTLVLRTFILGTIMSASGRCGALTGSTPLRHHLDRQSDMLEAFLYMLPDQVRQRSMGDLVIAKLLLAD